jgi:hypothetical protein
MTRRHDGRQSAAAIVFIAAVVWLSWPGGRTAVAAGAFCALFLVGLVRVSAEAAAMRPPGGSEFDEALRPVRSERPRPEDLQRAERVFGWKSYSADDFEHRIRPHLQRLIRVGVLARGGSDPAGDPEAAASLPSRLNDVAVGPPAETSFDTRDLEGIVGEIEAVRWR